LDAAAKRCRRPPTSDRVPAIAGLLEVVAAGAAAAVIAAASQQGSAFVGLDLTGKLCTSCCNICALALRAAFPSPFARCFPARRTLNRVI
jgi:hypothetical protein